MNKDKISIFCQAPGDVIHTLALYHKYSEKANISIYCINVENIYKYIKSLNLKLDNLEFIPYDFNLSIKNPLSIITTRKKLRKIYRNLFLKKENETIYFFSIWFDWVSFFFISKLYKRNKFIFYKHYLAVPEEGKTQYDFKEKIQLLQLYLITNIKLQYTTETSVKRLLFPYKKYNIKSQLPLKINQDIFKPYLYKTENNLTKSVLFFESELSNYNLFKNYIAETTEIIEFLQKQGFKVFIKGHPSLGSSKEISNICNSIIPKEIPAELLDVDSFDYIIGIQSSSLSYFAKEGNKVLSLINLLNFTQKKTKEMYIKYLNENSNNKVKYPKIIKELCK